MRESTTAPSFNVPLMDGKGPAMTGYGYQWWLFPGEDHAFQAVGIYGQNIWGESGCEACGDRLSSSALPVKPEWRRQPGDWAST